MTTTTSISEIMDGIVYAGADGRVQIMNPVAEEILGVKSFMVEGKTLVELEAMNDLTASLLSDREKAKETGKTSRTVEVYHDGGELLYIKVIISAVTNHHDEDAGILVVMEDVTSNHKYDQLKNQYLSIVAHELRTPLTAIKTFSTMLAKGSLGKLNEHQHRVTESIREQSLRLEHQIDKLINLGYIDSAEYDQDLQIVDVQETVASAIAPFEQVAKDRNIRIITRFPDVKDGGLLFVKADQTGLKRSLQALVENAVKFTPDGGKVGVGIAVSGENVVFSVQDTGIGIDPRYHGRIFEKFFQVEDPLTRHHGGAGLGLFVAQGVLGAHGAKISVESDVGKGARFTFCLEKSDEKDEVDLDTQESVTTSNTGVKQET